MHVGADVGLGLGNPVTIAVGPIVGETVTTLVGPNVGDIVVILVGPFVGNTVGMLLVGDAVTTAVIEGEEVINGALVGDSLQILHRFGQNEVNPSVVQFSTSKVLQ